MESLDAVRIGQAAYGKGVYARRRFKKGVIIGEVTGEIVETEGYDSNYCIDMGGMRCLEPVAPFRFLNHRCTPNCRFVWDEPENSSSDPQPRTVWVETLQIIEPGEELTIDYSWPADAAIRCGCRSPRCRGWIVDPSQLGVVESRVLNQSI